MGLQDLNEELYTREGAERENARPRQFDAGADSAESTASSEAFQAHSTWNTVQESFMSRNRKAIMQGVVICGIIIAVALAYFVAVRIQQSSFNSDRVTLKVDGPTSVSGSESSLFVFSLSNVNRSELTDAELTLTYPENFRPDAMDNMSINGSSSQIHIGTIAPHSQGKIELRGKFVGSKGSLAYIKGVLRYKPENASSSFQAESQIGVTIQSPSIKLSMEAPLEVASGGVVEYRVDYTNMSDVPFDNLRLKVEYPAGFHFQEATPKTSEGEAIWYVGTLSSGQSGSVRIVGTVDGTKDETKILTAHIGMLQGNGELLAYSDSERLTKIVASPISVQQTANNLNQLSVNPGSVIRYDVRYRNDGQIGLRNVIITVAVDGSALDYSKLQPSGGAFDDVKRIITWKASDVHELANLAPGKEGTVSFSVPVLSMLPVKTDADKNFVITSVAKVDSPDIATPTGSNKIIGSNTLRVKVNSGVDIQVATIYQDGVIPNAGPNPPVLGQETTYTIHWRAFNGSNDADKGVVSAYLPTGIRWIGKVSPSSENITYNERTNQITWNVGNIQSGIGSIRPIREVMFQVGLTPQVNQVGSTTPLLGETTFTAHDLFTDVSLESKQETQIVTISQ
ncbi:MAG: hypothetical protein PHT88_04165 [Candidatus Moranbacteria bacterium]|nr:hypothetical protein [Candidatus Moranbacteria bacterium]